MTMLRKWAVLLVLMPVLCQADDNGKGQYEFTGWEGPALRVFYTRPPGLEPDRPVVLVMHGQSRTAEKYRDDWHDLAIQHAFLLIVPEFTRADFPGSRSYNLGNRTDAEGNPIARERWSFSAPVAVFEEARGRFGMAATTFSLYGHSAGSQFVHRFLMHVSEAPVDRVVLANAGWYTMPDPSIDYPYGLRGSQIQASALRAFLAMPVTVLLGDADTLTRQENLRQSPEAYAQGPHRFARGHAFFESARKAAATLDVPFNWQRVTVPGADHDNAKMAPEAARLLLPD
jgi:poly(3-hydroxybutyrate) depolymerase